MQDRRTPTASERVDPDAGESLRVAAWSAFEAGDFAAAASAFGNLGSLRPLAESELRALVETLSELRRPEDATAAIETWLDAEVDIPMARRVAWADELFARSTAFAARDEVAANGLVLLELAAESGDESVWQRLAAGGRLRAVEEAMTSAAELLDALEQESYAPAATGIDAAATARIEELGHQHASDPVFARNAERLLHATGARAAAYRLERARRAATRHSPPKTAAQPAARRPLAGRLVVVAGGHAALRGRIRRDLLDAGAVDVREIPSAKEASRILRDVQAVMTGADLAVVLARQIAHSTSNQVRIAAIRLGVPVVVAETSGVIGVRRAIERHFQERGRPG
jgi:hypothetical protein